MWGLPAIWLLLLAASQAPAWRVLPLIANDGGGIHPSWVQVGWGGFAVDQGALRTECDERGMGLQVSRGAPQ